MIDKAITAIKREYNSEISTLKAKLLKVKESQAFICEKYDCLKENYDKLVKDTKYQENYLICNRSPIN